jgi:hypothetical protein
VLLKLVKTNSPASTITPITARNASNPLRISFVFSFRP